jgi:tetratricopeptide (TPR) repeat protein
MVDPEGTDDENRLWQEHGQPMPPVMIVFDADGKKLTQITALNPKYLAPQLGGIPGAYFDKVVPARAKLATDPAHTDSLVALGEAFVVLNQPKESAKRYAEAVASLTSKGDNAGALKILVKQLDLYFEEKWYQASRECCAKIAELDPKNESKARPRAAWVSGMGAIQDRRFDDAIIELKSAVDAYKDCGFVEQIMFSLGAAYKEKKDYDNALVWWDTIVMKHPETETAKTAETVAARLREEMQKGK